jgi:hypothetical protein
VRGDTLMKRQEVSTGITGTTQDHLLSNICIAELSKPFVISTNSSPVEGEVSVALTCEPETQHTTYRWINGHSLLAGNKLVMSKNSRIFTLLSVTRNNMGHYEYRT